MGLDLTLDLQDKVKTPGTVDTNVSGLEKENCLLDALKMIAGLLQPPVERIKTT